MSKEQQGTPEPVAHEVADLSEFDHPLGEAAAPTTSAEAAPPEITEQTVLDFITENPRCTIPEITAGFGAPKGAIAPIVMSLKDAHRVKTVGNREGYGTFVVTVSEHDPGRAPRHSGAGRYFPQGDDHAVDLGE